MLEEKISRPSIRIALTASFAALYIVMAFISPFIPLPGIPQLEIHMEASFASLFGIILGPWLGAISAFLGSLVGIFLLGGGMFNIPFIFNPAFNAFIVGLIFRKKEKYAFTIFAFTILMFFMTPVCIPLAEHWFVGILSTFDKIIALILIIPATMTLKHHRKQKTAGYGLSLLNIFLLAFIGNQADAALGNVIFAMPFIYQGIFGMPLEVTRSLFTISPLLYPFIRTVQAGIASILGLPLMEALRRLNIFE